MDLPLFLYFKILSPRWPEVLGRNDTARRF